MVLNLLYTRPAYVPPETSSASSIMSDTETIEPAASIHSVKPPGGIPESLSFDKILSNGTCPPCTVRDFMNFLLYVEHAAENLQFFLWYKGYVQRFQAAKPAETALSEPWTPEMQRDAWDAWQKAKVSSHKRNASAAATEVLLDERKVPLPEVHDPFVTPPRTSDGTSITGKGARIPIATAERWGSQTTMASPRGTSFHTSEGSELSANTPSAVASEAFEKAGLSQPFTIQPFRLEIERIIATYIVDGAPRQLNLSSWERKSLLRALEFTTHPSAFKLVASITETTLRRQAHPNFIRWTICNGNRPRVIFARGLGVSTILLGILFGTLAALSSLRRGYRAISAIFFVIGVATLIAAWKGMCVVLHGMHHRHLRPWELFTDFENDNQAAHSYDMRESLDSVLSSNSYEDAPWVVKYQKRNIIRKVFDREIWVEEPALRQIQDTIFIQSVLCALVAAGILTTIFVVVPAGNHM